MFRDPLSFGPTPHERHESADADKEHVPLGIPHVALAPEEGRPLDSRNRLAPVRMARSSGAIAEK